MAVAHSLRGPELLRAHLESGGARVTGSGPILGVSFALAAGVEGELALRWQPGVLELAVCFPVPVGEANMPLLADTLATLGDEAWLPGFVLERDRVEYRVSLLLDRDGSLATRVLDRALGVCRAYARKYFPRLMAAAAGKRSAAEPALVTYEPSELSLTQLAWLRELVARERPSFAARLHGPVIVNELRQPFFTRHRVLQLQSPSPMPALALFVAVASDGQPLVLSGHPDNLRAIARVDRPKGLGDPAVARAYGHIAGEWTRASDLPELMISSVDEIPWHRELSPAEEASVARLRETHGKAIHPQRLEPTEQGWRLTLWVVSESRLVRRQLDIPVTGELRREDQVVVAALAVPPGRFWAIVGDRFVPVG